MISDSVFSVFAGSAAAGARRSSGMAPRVHRAAAGDDRRQMRPDQSGGRVLHPHHPDVPAAPDRSRRSRYSLRSSSSPAISRMTGFAAKKVGERTSQASSAANHSASGCGRLRGRRRAATGPRNSALGRGWHARSFRTCACLGRWLPDAPLPEICFATGSALRGEARVSTVLRESDPHSTSFFFWTDLTVRVTIAGKIASTARGVAHEALLAVVALLCAWG